MNNAFDPDQLCRLIGVKVAILGQRDCELADLQRRFAELETGAKELDKECARLRAENDQLRTGALDTVNESAD